MTKDKTRHDKQLVVVYSTLLHEYMLTQTRTKMLGIHLNKWATINTITIVRFILARRTSLLGLPSKLNDEIKLKF